MKTFILLLIVFAACYPLLGQEQSKPKAPEQPKPPTFKPLIPDSLLPKDLTPYLHPERNPEFQKRHGVILVDPNKVELNPGGILKADPTVDLGMIYPLETQKKLLLKKNRRMKPPIKPYFKIPKPPAPDEDMEEDKEKSE